MELKYENYFSFHLTKEKFNVSILLQGMDITVQEFRPLIYAHAR